MSLAILLLPAALGICAILAVLIDWLTDLD